MSMWPEFTEDQQACQKIAWDLLGKKGNDPYSWADVERLVREAFIERSKQRHGGNFSEGHEEIVNSIVDMVFEEDIHLIWPIIRRFFIQR